MQQVTNLIPTGEFTFGTTQVRTILKDGEPWFVAKDICDVLEIKNSRMALERLDSDEKDVSSIDTLGGAQAMQIVNESGLYALTLGSRKPQAKPFRKWITGEVLPSIRRRGMYVVGQQKIRAELLDALALNIQTKALPALKEYDRLTENLHWKFFDRQDDYLRRHNLAVDTVALQFDLPRSLVAMLAGQGMNAVNGDGVFN